MDKKCKETLLPDVEIRPVQELLDDDVLDTGSAANGTEDGPQ